MSRFSRQMKLAEIGEAGQVKIARGEVTVARGFSGWIASRYLAAAGVAKIRESEIEAADPRFDTLDPAARDVALGAHAAVVAIKKLIA
jgi:hypothetical protein